MKDFLNPKSMITPGAAGALMMLLANAVCAAFPELAFRFVAIALSFLIGFAIMASADLKLRERAMYGIVNSLVIFSVGIGTSNATANATATSPAATLPVVVTPHSGEPTPGAKAATHAPRLNQRETAPEGFFRRW